MTRPDYIIHTDGGSRGNPGPSAIGAVIDAADRSVHKEYGEYIGSGTNNEAEYKAVIFGLQKLKLLVGKKKARISIIAVFVDSELLVKQINGLYKISEPRIQDLFIELWNLRTDFKQVMFEHVPREQNQGADRMVNIALDAETNKLL